MKFPQRLVANAIAIFLALFLVDSVAEGRFRVEGVWVAVIVALLLTFFNSLMRPLPRVRTKTWYALLTAALTVLVNALILQLFVWASALSSWSFVWVLATAALISLIAGVINWLVGFNATAKGRTSKSNLAGTKRSRGRERKPSRTRTPR